MSWRIRLQTASLLAAGVALAVSAQVLAQSNSPNELAATQPHTTGVGPTGSSASELLRVPLVKTTPGAVATGENVQNPAAKDPQTAQRGMKYFIDFNCVGCHAPNGGGGMGPSLSDPAFFKYGTDPAALFLVISHGAPLGMPAWGTVLPQSVIWDIVSYIESINKIRTERSWGTTVAAAEQLPGKQQVPAEFKQTANPWDYTEPFGNGKKPSGGPGPQ